MGRKMRFLNLLVVIVFYLSLNTEISLLGYSEKAVKLNFKVWNSSQKGLPIVLIHGWGGSLKTWHRVIPYFTTRPVYAVDLRGHGKTEIGNGDFSIQQIMADLTKFFKDQQLTRVILIGHSMGARVAVAFAVNNKSLIDALVIEDIDMEPRDINKYKRGPNHSHARYMSFRELLVSRVGLEAFSKLNETSIPVLLLKGQFNSKCSKKGFKTMKRLLPRLRSHTVAGTSHMIHLNDSFNFSNLVHRFIYKVRANKQHPQQSQACRRMRQSHNASF